MFFRNTIRTFSVPFADLSHHLPEYRYDRPETANRVPIRVSVLDFWVVPVLPSRRNLCSEVVRFVCSSSSTLLPYFPNVTYSCTVSYSPCGGLKMWRLKNHLYDPWLLYKAFNPFASQIGFSLFFLLSLFALSQSFLSIRQCDFRPRTTHLRELCSPFILCSLFL